MANTKKEKYLPIGTVVLLKEADKRLMITGFCVLPKEEESTVYDYCGCLFPEGIISTDQTALFNHDQIDKIYYMGYSDAEEKEFKENLKKLLKTGELLLASDDAESTSATIKPEL